MERHGPLIVAHRGSSGTAPENTCAAFRRAIADGADMIELDIRLTLDGKIVVLHDRRVNRTTNGSGSVRRKTLAELTALDAGSWYGRAFAGERVPSLHQVIDLLPPGMSLNIEVKTDGDSRKGRGFAESLVRILHQQRFVHRSLVSSFDHGFLKRLHALDPAISTGALYSPVRDMRKRPSAVVRNARASVFICSIVQLRRQVAQDLQTHGIPFSCYGVNTARQLARAVKYGAAMVITDFPAVMRKLLQDAGRGG